MNSFTWESAINDLKRSENSMKKYIEEEIKPSPIYKYDPSRRYRVPSKIPRKEELDISPLISENIKLKLEIEKLKRKVSDANRTHGDYRDIIAIQDANLAELRAKVAKLEERVRPFFSWFSKKKPAEPVEDPLA